MLDSSHFWLKIVHIERHIALHFIKNCTERICIFFEDVSLLRCRSQWPRSLSRRSAAARLLRLWVRIPPGAWMFVYCECFVLSDRGLCHQLITRPEQSWRLWCVFVCDIETPWMRRPWPTGGCCAKKKKVTINVFLFIWISDSFCRRTVLHGPGSVSKLTFFSDLRRVLSRVLVRQCTCFCLDKRAKSRVSGQPATGLRAVRTLCIISIHYTRRLVWRIRLYVKAKAAGQTMSKTRTPSWRQRSRPTRLSCVIVVCEASDFMSFLSVSLTCDVLSLSNDPMELTLAYLSHLLTETS